jgi:ParB family transcriptional regulator, chromosome partitioning protein
MSSELRQIPLEALRVSPFNLRTPDDGTPEFQQLLASIEANGVLEPLVVEPTRDGTFADGLEGGRYDVLQGGHRLLALSRLAHLSGEADGVAPCQVFSGLTEAEAREVALATTVIRRPTHPVDEYEAFARLEAEGCSAADIARRFGLAERQVKQRLALGGLCPEARERWRAGELDYDAAAALTQAGDFERQRQALTAVRKERQAWWRAQDVVRTIRRINAEGRIRADQSGEWRYAEAEYRAAGGAVVEDLFSDEVMIENVPLLKQLAKAKAIAEGEAFQREHGFGACFFFEGNEAADTFERTEIDLEEFELTLAETQALEDSKAAIDALMPWPAINAIKDHDEQSAARKQRLEREEQLDDEREKLLAQVELRLFKENCDLARHAVGVRIRADGELIVTFGHVIPGMGEAEQQDQPERRSLPTTQDAPAAKPAPEPKGLADSHRAELAVLFTEACRQSLRLHPLLALPVLIAALRAQPSFAAKPLVFDALYKVRVQGVDFDEELLRIVSSKPEVIAATLAETVLPLVSLGSGALERKEHAGFVILLEGHDKEFQARLRVLFDAAEFFGRAPREIMEEAARELALEGYRPAAPKKEMLPIVAAEAKRRGWLPPILRTDKYALLPAEATPATKKAKTPAAKAKPSKGKAARAEKVAA